MFQIEFQVNKDRLHCLARDGQIIYEDRVHSVSKVKLIVKLSGFAINFER